MDVSTNAMQRNIGGACGAFFCGSQKLEVLSPVRLPNLCQFSLSPQQVRVVRTVLHCVGLVAGVLADRTPGIMAYQILIVTDS